MRDRWRMHGACACVLCVLYVPLRRRVRCALTDYRIVLSQAVVLPQVLPILRREASSNLVRAHSHRYAPVPLSYYPSSLLEYPLSAWYFSKTIVDLPVEILATIITGTVGR